MTDDALLLQVKIATVARFLRYLWREKVHNRS